MSELGRLLVSIASFLAYLPLAVSASHGVKVMCPLDNQGETVAVICSGHLGSERYLLKWKIIATTKGQVWTQVMTCDTRRGLCRGDSDPSEFTATVTAGSGRGGIERFISVLSLKTLFGNGQATRSVTCSLLDSGGGVHGDGQEVTLCRKNVPGEGNISPCPKISSLINGALLLCGGAEPFCLVQQHSDPALRTLEKIEQRADTTSNKTTTLISLCKRNKVTSMSPGRQTFGFHVSHETVPGPRSRHRYKRSSTGNDCSEGPPQIVDTKGDSLGDCRQIPKNGNLTFQCRTSEQSTMTCCRNWTVDHQCKTTKASEYVEVYGNVTYNGTFCNCTLHRDDACAKQGSTAVVFAFESLGQSCASPADGAEQAKVGLYYVIAGVLAVICFIFLSSTCAFVYRHGASLYSYYYPDHYPPFKREVIAARRPRSSMFPPPLPPPRLPPRRVETNSVISEGSYGVNYDPTTEESESWSEEDVFTTVSTLVDQTTENVDAETGRKVNGIRISDDGYLLPKFFTLPSRRGAAGLPRSTPSSTSPPAMMQNDFTTLPVHKDVSKMSSLPPLPCRRERVHRNFSVNFRNVPSVPRSGESDSRETGNGSSDDSCDTRSVRSYLTITG